MRLLILFLLLTGCKSSETKAKEFAETVCSCHNGVAYYQHNSLFVSVWCTDDY